MSGSRGGGVSGRVGRTRQKRRPPQPPAAPSSPLLSASACLVNNRPVLLDCPRPLVCECLQEGAGTTPRARSLYDVKAGLEEAAKGPGGGPWEALAPRAAAPRADPGGGCSHKGRRAEQPGGEAGWAEGAVFLSWSSLREFEGRREAGAGGHVPDGVSSAPSLLGYGPCVPTCAVRITPCAPRPRRLLWKAAPASVHVICWPGLAESML